MFMPPSSGSATLDTSGSAASASRVTGVVERTDVGGESAGSLASEHQERVLDDEAGVAESPLSGTSRATASGSGAYDASAGNDESTEPAEPVDAQDEFRERYQLSGVVHSEGSSVVLLSDRTSNTTRRILSDTKVDGWIVKDAGPNFAVFGKDDSEVRLLLNETWQP
jgi:hypothetical protein